MGPSAAAPQKPNPNDSIIIPSELYNPGEAEPVIEGMVNINKWGLGGELSICTRWIPTTNSGVVDRSARG